jgi:multiple sugar transport system substrate-binding protein
MARIRLRGITWQHRRAIDPLVNSLPAFREVRPDIEVDWQARPLSGFEFQPVAELAEQYDLIILDHPFAGHIAEGRYLLPLDVLVREAPDIAFAGPSLASYRYGGHVWALPMDGACQVAVYRPDLLTRCGGEAPKSWDDMLALGEAGAGHGLRLAMGLAGVHSLMTFFSLCANLGRPCATDPSVPFADGDTARAALDALRRLLALCPPEALDWSSIAVQDALAARDDLVYCPAVYGFASYAEADATHPLAFAGFPGLRAPYCAGSTLGGTGLGISAHTAEREAAFAYAGFLASAKTQKDLFAAHHGQPARVEAWDDAAVNARFGNFFADTRATMDAAWLRPRYAGYLAFQHRAGTLVENHLRGALNETQLLTSLAKLHAGSTSEGAEAAG